MNLEKFLRSLRAPAGLWLCAVMFAELSHAATLYPTAPSYLTTPVLPNVAVMIDNSGSMNCAPGHNYCNSGTTPEAGNKIGIARTVIRSLVDPLWSAARWSLFSFNPASVYKGAIKLADFNDGQAAFDSGINGLLAKTGTPTGDALYQIANYFVGGKSVFPTGQTCNDDSCTYAYQQYTSPIQYVCQKNFAVIITDGQANAQNTNGISVNGYTLNTYIASKYGVALNTTADYEQVANIAAMYQDYGVAPAGATQDLDGNAYSRSSTLGYPALSTYTIGFGNSDGLPAENLLRATAYYGEPPEQRTSDGAYSVGMNASYYQVANSQSDLSDALTSVFTSIQNQVGSATAGTFTNPGGAGQMYQASFNTNSWTGQLTGYPYSNGSFNTASTITASVPSSGRVVLTSSGGTGTTFTSSSLGSVTFNPASSIAKSTVASFVLGTDSAPTTRTRASLLGDMLNSQPVAFTNKDASNAAMVAVGANDGMLHVFDAGTLSEVLAYVPATVQPALGALADPGYGGSMPHQYYVNGPLVEEDAGGVTSLVGTLAQGGRGVFALNVSNKSNFSNASTVLWERNSSSAGFANLGYTFAKPVIAKVNNGTDGTITWAAIVASGYDSGTSCGSTCTRSSKSSLFVINLSTGAIIKELAVPSGNGLSSPAALNTNAGTGSDRGVVDRVYAGDLSGKLWVFDLSNTDPAQWSVVSQPLVQASSNQPITSRPIIKKLSQGYMVIFGTGQLMYSGDENSTTLQTMYGVQDTLSSTSWPVALSSLQKNTISEEASATVQGKDGVSRTYLARNVVAGSPTVSAPAGWYLSLQSPGLSDGGGERMLYDPILVFGRLYFTTQIPKVNTTNHCLTGGAGWLMALDPSTGLKWSISPLDLDYDGKATDADKVKFASSSTAQIIAGYKITAGMPSALGFAAGSKTMSLSSYQSDDGQVGNSYSTKGTTSSGGNLVLGISGASASNKDPGCIGSVCPKPFTADPGVHSKRMSWREIY